MAGCFYTALVYNYIGGTHYFTGCNATKYTIQQKKMKKEKNETLCHLCLKHKTDDEVKMTFPPKLHPTAQLINQHKLTIVDRYRHRCFMNLLKNTFLFLFNPKSFEA